MSKLYSAVLPSPEAASAWARGIISARQSGELSLSAGSRADYAYLDRATTTHGGWRTVTRSSTARELTHYGYDAYVSEMDMKYLARRDPTARMVFTWAAQDTFGKMPRTPDETYDSWFGDLELLGFCEAATRCDSFRARDGIAYLYINASAPIIKDDEELPGRPDLKSPIRPGEQFFGFQVIRRDQLDEQEPIFQDLDAAGLPVDIYRYYPDRNQKGSTKPIEIHTDRIIPFVDDPFQESIIDADPEALAMYDDLSNLRDIIHAQTRGIIQGNPIVASVDVANEYELGDGDETSDLVDSELSKLADGSTQSVAPVEGIIFKRLGPTDLDDASNITKLLTSRISQVTRIPVNMIIASSRGSEQVTDMDDLRWQSIVDRRARRLLVPILIQLDARWKKAHRLARRSKFPIRKLAWPYLMRLSEKDQMLNDKNQALNLNIAKQSGYVPNARWLRDGYDEIVEAQDPRLILPAPPRYILQDISEDADGYPGWEDDDVDPLDKAREDKE